MGFEIPIWHQTERFIDGLKGYHIIFIRIKRDEIRDPKSKGKITELDLEELMDQLIARAIDHKDRQKPAQALKAEDKPNEKPDDKNKPDTSLPTPRGGSPQRRSSTRGSRRGRGGYHNQQSWAKCGYCNRPGHKEDECRMKNYANQSQEWQTINASAIEYFKKKNEGKTANLKPATPATPTTPSTPTPMANPNVGYTAMAFSTTTTSSRDPN
jgi:hypothetical protein